MSSLAHPPVRMLRGQGPHLIMPTSFSPACIVSEPQRQFYRGDTAARRLSVLSTKMSTRARRLKRAIDRLEADYRLAQPRFSPPVTAHSKTKSKKLRDRQVHSSVPRKTNERNFHRRSRSTGATTAVPSLRSVWSGVTRGIGQLWTTDGPIQWTGKLLFVDMANCLKALRSGRFKGTEFAMRELARLPASRGCHVLAMVEGHQREIKAPAGVHVIRAQPIARKNIGDDAIVDYIKLALAHGLEPNRLVLVTEDRRLMRRIASGVQKRSPQWLRAELVALDELEFTRADEAARAPTAPSKVKETTPGAPRPVPVGVSWWQGWMASLRSLLWPALASTASQGRGGLTKASGLQRS